MIIWLASYPKSGNTFMRALLSSYFFSKDGICNFETLKNIKQFPYGPLFKKIGIDIRDDKKVVKNYIKAQEVFNKNNSVQFIKTHSALFDGFTNYQNTLGVIYIIRDPRNVAISAANHFNYSLEESVNRLLNPCVLGGFNNKINRYSVVHHITSWSVNYLSWKLLEKQNRYLLIKYEDLTQNTEFVLNKILEFIYKLMNQDFSIDKNKFINVIQSTKFEKLQKLEKETKFDESVKHDGEKKTFFKYGPKSNSHKILDKSLKEKIETSLKNEMRELGYL
jgi:hypothetical protein